LTTQQCSPVHLQRNNNNIINNNNNNNNSISPPPAPRKINVRKMIKVSSRVRRKLNFDDCGPTGGNQEDDTIKRMRMDLFRDECIVEPAKNLFQPIAIQATCLPGLLSTPVKISNPESRVLLPSSGGVGVVNHPMASPMTSSVVGSTNLNELLAKPNDNDTLMVDSEVYTTPDKCMCKNTREQNAELAARLKGPLLGLGPREGSGFVARRGISFAGPLRLWVVNDNL